MTVDVEFLFLMGGPVWMCRLPDGYLASPRSIDVPVIVRPSVETKLSALYGEASKHRRPQYMAYVESLAGRGGYSVDVYRRLGEPAVWFVEWKIDREVVLFAHVNASHEYRTAAQLVDGVEPIGSPNALAISLSGGLEPSTSVRPDHQEVAVFAMPRDPTHERRGDAQVIEFGRPPRLSKGATRIREDAFDPATETYRSFVEFGCGPLDLCVSGMLAASEAVRIANDVAPTLNAR